MSRTYQICTRCLLDTTDPAIEFDQEGVCNHCRRYETLASQQGHYSDEALQQMVARIKAAGQGKEYDCLLGVSGGVDSTYAAYMLKKLGVRTLAVHMDNGWDSELAVSNIEKFLKQLDIDLVTYVLDWEEFKDLQLAFLKASVPDGEIPTDHAIGAVVLRVADQHDIKYIISGTNTVTEAILPQSWTYGIADWTYIRGVHRKFGTLKLKNFPKCSFMDRFYYGAMKRIQTVRFLDYLPYNKKEALRVLQEELGWQYYGGKHYESIYTRFFQGYILPRKFNIDKRRAHLSNLICSGQMSRDEALEELEQPIYAGHMLKEDHAYVLKKFEITEEEFEQLMTLDRRTHIDYPNHEWFQQLVNRIQIEKIARQMKILPVRGNGG